MSLEKTLPKLWICSTSNASCLLLEPENSGKDWQEMSMIKNEDFIRHILAQALLGEDKNADEIFYIFGLTYELTWTSIRKFLLEEGHDLVFRYQNALTYESYSIDLMDLNYKYSYTLNTVEERLKDQKLVSPERANEFILFVINYPSKNRKPMAELFVGGIGDRIKDRRHKLQGIDWTRVNEGRPTTANKYYTVTELEELLSKNGIPVPRGVKKAELIKLLKDHDK